MPGYHQLGVSGRWTCHTELHRLPDIRAFHVLDLYAYLPHSPLLTTRSHRLPAMSSFHPRAFTRQQPPKEAVAGSIPSLPLLVQAGSPSRRPDGHTLPGTTGKPLEQPLSGSQSRSRPFPCRTLLVLHCNIDQRFRASSRSDARLRILLPTLRPPPSAGGGCPTDASPFRTGSHPSPPRTLVLLLRAGSTFPPTTLPVTTIPRCTNR